jgi:peptidoglycan hydrolase CwlO-like protein
MNWEIIVSAIVGMLTGGGVSWLFKLREDKAGSQADAIDKAADAMKKLLDNADQQQATFNKIIESKDNIIEQQRKLIENYKVALDEANKKIKEFEYKVADNERKIAGMQKIIESEICERKKAEHNICFVTECQLRKPKLGTYRSK